MKSLTYLLSVICACTLILSCSKSRSDICGTWRMVEGTYVGPDFSVTTDAESRICYKVISDDHFAVVEVYADNPDSMFFAAVGSYKLDDSTYTETYEASNVQTKIGEKMEFQSNLKEKTWKISRIKDDLHLEETWVCVKAMSGNTHEL